MEHTAYRRAERRVERKIRFFIHLAVYLAVNGGLLLSDLLHRPDKPWSFWPLFGWGIGLLFHGLSVFLNGPGTTWKQRMIERELKKLPTPT